jgi:hypothetical protein
MRLYRTLVAVGAALLAGPLLTLGTAQAAPSAKGKTWSPVLMSSEPLYDGSAVRLHYTGGITVVASTGAKVIFKGSGALSITANGRHVYNRAVRITDPHVLGKSSATAAGYSAAGRSVYSDALAAGFSPAQARRQAAQPLSEPRS